MYQLSRRILMIASATVALVAVPAFAAEAKVLKVTGKQTTVTPSSSLTSFLASRNIKVAAVAPATLSGGTVTFPITGGAVKSPSLNGRLILGGGLQFTRKTHSVTLSSIVVRRNGSKAVVSATVGHRRLNVARATGTHLTVSGKTGTVTGDLRLSAAAARAINKLAGKHLVSAGADLGSFTSTVTVA